MRPGAYLMPSVYVFAGEAYYVLGASSITLLPYYFAWDYIHYIYNQHMWLYLVESIRDSLVGYIICTSIAARDASLTFP